MINAFRTNLAAKRSELSKDDKGFTLIELLVVILIIGILTAIAVPVFIGQQDQAKDAATKSDLGVAKVALISWYTANPDAAAAPTADQLGEYGYEKSAEAGALVLTGVVDSGDFCIQATTTDTGHTFSITESGGAVEAACGA